MATNSDKSHTNTVPFQTFKPYLDNTSNSSCKFSSALFWCLILFFITELKYCNKIGTKCFTNSRPSGGESSKGKESSSVWFTNPSSLSFSNSSSSSSPLMRLRVSSKMVCDTLEEMFSLRRHWYTKWRIGKRVVEDRERQLGTVDVKR